MIILLKSISSNNKANMKHTHDSSQANHLLERLLRSFYARNFYSKSAGSNLIKATLIYCLLCARRFAGHSQLFNPALRGGLRCKSRHLSDFPWNSSPEECFPAAASEVERVGRNCLNNKARRGKAGSLQGADAFPSRRNGDLGGKRRILVQDGHGAGGCSAGAPGVTWKWFGGTRSSTGRKPLRLPQQQG